MGNHKRLLLRKVHRDDSKGLNTYSIKGAQVLERSTELAYLTLSENFLWGGHDRQGLCRNVSFRYCYPGSVI